MCACKCHTSSVDLHERQLDLVEELYLDAYLNGEDVSELVDIDRDLLVQRSSTSPRRARVACLATIRAIRADVLVRHEGLRF